jgi:hypothetical protein
MKSSSRLFSPCFYPGQSAWATVTDQHSPDALELIASARRLTDLDRHEEATQLLDEAGTLLSRASEESRSETRIRAMRELSLLLERTNRTSALRSVLDQAQASGIDLELIGLPAAAIALLDGRPERAKQLLLHDNPDNYPVRWFRLMVRIADAIGDHDGAFDAALAMKQRVRGYDSWRKRAAAHLQWVRLLATGITPDWARQLPVLEDKPGSPAFLVGFPRSGTTLLDTFLMGHADIAVIEERGMMAAAQRAVGDIAALAERTPLELGQARRAYLEELHQYADPSFAGVVLDKLPLNMIAAPLIHCLFPDARLIFAQRHPCDVVLSCFMQGFALNDSMACFLDLVDAAAYYDAAMTVWTKSREMLRLQTHSVIYEQLVNDPNAAIRPAVEFLGLGWRPRLLRHVETARARGAISTPSYNQVTQPLSERASGRWRRYEKQLTPVLPVLLPWAERLGYPAD